jgi:Chaperone of endosialidase
MKIKSSTLLLLLLCCSKLMYAQNIGIGTNSPNASSLLEVNSNSKGILIPRVSLQSTTDVTTIPNPVNALLVYNNNPALPDGRGFYYYNTFINEWSRLATNINLNNIDYWSFSGNNGTDPAINFIGTTDNKALIFKTNNLLSGKIDPGPNNVFFGQKAGNVTTGVSNSFFGHTAGEVNTTGFYNTAVGNSSLSLNTEGIQNTAIGTFALDSNTTASNNVAIGLSAMRSNTTKPNNTAIGVRAFFSQRGGFSDGDNVAVGYEAAKDIENCYGCTFIGANTSSSFAPSSTLNEAAAFGEGAIVDASYTMMFGSTNVAKWGFGRTSVASFRAIEVGDDVNSGNGAYLSSSGTWTNVSDAFKKEDFSQLNGTELLQKISSLPITKWKYKGANDYHIGPTAQDFYKAFGLGIDDKGISTVDPAGIALAAIQEQQKIIAQLLVRIETLEKK